MTPIAIVFGAPFIQTAAIALAMLAVVVAAVGVALNLRGLEFVSDGLVHAVFPGIVIGFILGGGERIYIGAAIAALIATVLLTLAARKGTGTDAATAVMLAGTFALGIVIVSRTTRYSTGLEQLLFGQLLTINSHDLIYIAVLGGIAIALVGTTWKMQTFISFDRQGAIASGVSVLRYELILNIAIAIVVVAASRAVGNLLVLALLIVPAAIGRCISRDIRVILVVALFSALLGSFAGLLGGYWLSVDAELSVSPSAVLVLALVAVYFIVAIATTLVRAPWRARQQRQRGQVDAAADTEAVAA
ncbi:metal ABC transporter permease [Gulosibacter bifidus]|uniref:Metal ABC transporter permease n=1 Tax=Gulosibacter bifidus TaxID=272239 RepID=A0ABW5RJB6_9MICO|nr:metal ABC transporter permease [Gulosibacter bifidus]